MQAGNQREFDISCWKITGANVFCLFKSSLFLQSTSGAVVLCHTYLHMLLYALHYGFEAQVCAPALVLYVP